MITAVMMVKDEDDIIDVTVRNLFDQGVDRLLVYDNGSTDGTRDILEAFGAEVQILDDPEPGYYQSEKTSRLAVMAWEHGSDWVLPVDADEIFYGHDGTIAESLKTVDAEIIYVWGYDHIPQRSDNPGLDPVRRMQWRRGHHQRFPCVLFKASPDVVVQMGNHDVIRSGRATIGPLGYRHFQYRSFEQMVRKVRQGKAAYDASDLHATHGAHWRDLGALDDAALWGHWTALLDSTDLVLDPCPLP